MTHDGVLQFGVYDRSTAAKGAVKVLITVYVGFVGAIGLMQVKPKLSMWITTCIRIVQRT